ncbi:MAG: AsmA family protein, partial [Dysgonamonadaceae bacterium]|nr:AsmA family protein [Dysgonamonadaceae bacterium]
MKKFLKIAGISLLVILLLLAILPFAFKGKIIEIAKKEVNKSMNASIDFEHLGLNFFKSFPNASVSLENFYVAGINEFEGDTLLFAKNLSATVNIKSFFGNSGYEIIKVELKNARVHAIVHEDGKANWNIVPETEDETPVDTTETAFKLSLKKVSIRNTSIYFDNDSSRLNLAVENLNLDLSGDMTADETRIRTGFTIDSLTFISDNIPFLSKARIKSKIDVDADLKNNKFTLADNSFEINAIKAGVDGWLALLEDEGMEMDLKLNAPSVQFKDVLSLIPAIYYKDFNGLKTSGEASLDASVKGTMRGEQVPAFDVKLNIAKAFFQYPGMPQSVSNIHTQIWTTNPGGTADSTIVDIAGFHFEMGGNPFDLKLHLSHPVSDPDINLSAVGKLDLGMVKEIYPLENTNLSGKLEANLQVATRMSAIQKEQYESVNALGTLHISQILLQSEGTPDIRLDNANLSFSPRYVDLTGLTAQIGRNDIAASGKLENFIPYFLKNETLKGNLSVSSNYLNL